MYATVMQIEVTDFDKVSPKLLCKYLVKRRFGIINISNSLLAIIQPNNNVDLSAVALVKQEMSSSHEKRMWLDSGYDNYQ